MAHYARADACVICQNGTVYKKLLKNSPKLGCILSQNGIYARSMPKWDTNNSLNKRESIYKRACARERLRPRSPFARQFPFPLHSEKRIEIDRAAVWISPSPAPSARRSSRAPAEKQETETPTRPRAADVVL